VGLQAGAIETLPAKVIWYDRVKGYGFLAVEGHPEDVFLHNSEVRRAGIDATTLLKGTAVRCNVGESGGRPCAVDLEEA
jgi:CspA family cold shock protein